MKHRDGRWVWVQARGQIVEWTSDGRSSRMTGTCEDITAAHVAAMRLSEAEGESRLALDRSRVPTCLVSNDGRFLRANPALCGFLGRSEAELLTLAFLDVVHPDDRGLCAELMSDRLAGHRPTLRVSLLEAQRIAHVGGWQLEPATGVVTWSPELFSIFGLDPAGPAPQYPEQERLFTPDSWRRLVDTNEVTRTTGAPYRLELQTIRADGSFGWVQILGEAQRDSEGTVVDLHGVSLDITERKADEKSLAVSAELLRVVLDTSQDPTIRVDRTGRIAYVNQRSVDVSGISNGGWIGSTFAEMGYPAALADTWATARRNALDTGSPVTFEFEIDNAEGHRWYETTVAPEVNRVGSSEFTIETSRDITDRNLIEAELRASRAQLQRAQRIAHVGSWTLDLSTNHVGWSEELYLMLGLDPSVAPPDYPEHRALFTPTSWAELSTALVATREAGVPYELELELVGPDGTFGWVLARGEAVLDEDGAITGLAGVAIDITARKIASDEFEVMATHDPLTGLANRAALLDVISSAVTAGRGSNTSTAVLMVDLDRFKEVNDTMGHAAGDDLLTATARRIERVVAGDGVPPAVHDRRGRGAGDGLCRGAVAAGSGTLGALLNDADAAMYAAKERGRDPHLTTTWAFIKSANQSRNSA